MKESLSAHAPILDQARSLLLRRDYDAARSVLKDLVRRDPDCTEAIRLLLSVDEAQQRQRMHSDEAEDGLLSTGGISRKSAGEIKALLMGAVLLAVGVWYLFQTARVGMGGQFPVTNKTGGVHMVSGKTALLYGLGFGVPGAFSFLYGLRRLRLK